MWQRARLTRFNRWKHRQQKWRGPGRRGSGHHNLQTERVQLEGDNKELAVSETVEPEVGLRAEGG